MAWCRDFDELSERRAGLEDPWQRVLRHLDLGTRRVDTLAPGVCPEHADADHVREYANHVRERP